MSPAADLPIDPDTGLVHLSEADCWERLEAEDFGRLAVAVGTHPDIFPVNYRVWNGLIVVRTEAGTKLAGAVLSQSVAFEIDGVDHDAHTGWSVVVSGWAREAEKLDEIMQLEELDLELWVQTPKTRWLLITPESVTGRLLPPLTPDDTPPDRGP